MSERKLFYSKKFFIFNVGLVGIIAGFVLSFILFNVPIGVKSEEPVYAQEIPNSRSQVLSGQESADGYAPGGYAPASFNQVAAKALPSVVELKVVEIIEQTVPSFNGWPWNFLQPQNGDDSQSENSRKREYKSQGLGSGVIVQRRGNAYYILTNNHVAGKADEIKAVLDSGEEYTASIVGHDERKDLALVKITTIDDLPVAELGDSDDLQVGDWVLAVGSPFGFVSSVTAGIVSAKGRSGPADNISDFIQTDAAINRGNSGGALVDMNGRVVGINTWIAAPTGGNVGLGFAIPINNAKKVIDDLINNGKVEYGWLGVSISGVSEEYAEKMDLPDQDGTFVHNVYIDSPADRGGLQPGDFIVAIDGRSVENRDEVVRMVGDFKAGQRVEFTIVRSGQTRNLRVRIGERLDNEALQTEQNKLWPGMVVAPLEDEARQQLNLNSSANGVLVGSVERQSKAYIGGLRPYDLIVEINGEKIGDLQDFYRAINGASSDKYEIAFIREGSKFFAGITK